MAMVAPPTNDRKRVKVYELRNNDWFDRGTGFCTGQVVNVRTFTGFASAHSCGFRVIRSPLKETPADILQRTNRRSLSSLRTIPIEYY